MTGTLLELQPLGVLREDPGVEHVGVGDDDVPMVPHGAPRVGGRVAGVGIARVFVHHTGVGGLGVGEVVRGANVGQVRVVVLPRNGDGHIAVGTGAAIAVGVPPPQWRCDRRIGPGRCAATSARAGRSSISRAAPMIPEAPHPMTGVTQLAEEPTADIAGGAGEQDQGAGHD